MKKLLILHGALGCKNQFKSIVSELESNFEIELMNFSGHGGKPFKESFNISQFAQDVIDYLNENQISSINVFGYSMGGYVALYLAKNFPNRIEKIITLGTKFLWTPEIAIKEVKMINPEKIEEKVPAFAHFLKNNHSPIDWKQLLNRTGDMMLEMGQKNPLQLCDFREINHEVKIGLAENDEMVSKSETMEVVNAIENGSFYSLSNSKHPIDKSNLDQLIEEITNHFK